MSNNNILQQQAYMLAQQNYQSQLTAVMSQALNQNSSLQNQQNLQNLPNQQNLQNLPNQQNPNYHPFLQRVEYTQPVVEFVHAILEFDLNDSAIYRGLAKKPILNCDEFWNWCAANKPLITKDRFEKIAALQ